MDTTTDTTAQVAAYHAARKAHTAAVRARVSWTHRTAGDLRLLAQERDEMANATAGDLQ